MANAEHVEVVLQGAAAVAEWRRQNPEARLDLSGADLAKADLSAADLAAADLSGADLSWAHLTGAVLTRADLRGAVLRRADLTGANLRGADLAGADLSGADLAKADLSGAVLRRANLTRADLTKAGLFWAHLMWADVAGARLGEARLGSTSLGGCDLSQATGLSSVNHRGPSSIGVDALIASFRGAGNRLTPELESFFMTAGVPKELLVALPGIVGAVEFHSCFISYGQPDLDFAQRLRGDLVARGVPCWLYALDATPGERTWKEIGGKRREAGKMVVICSAAALIRPGALKEIEEQIDEDPDMMVPISRDNLWTEPGFQVMRAGRDLGPWLRDRNYADFSDDSRHEDSLQRLLTALRRKAA